MQQIAAVIMIMFDWLSDSATIQATCKACKVYHYAVERLTTFQQYSYTYSAPLQRKELIQLYMLLTSVYTLHRPVKGSHWPEAGIIRL